MGLEMGPPAAVDYTCQLAVSVIPDSHLSARDQGRYCDVMPVFHSCAFLVSSVLKLEMNL
jgi:hypothetical protein